MIDVNRITLIGRLVREPILRHSSEGVPMGFFTLAANHSSTDKEGARREETAFLACKAFGRWAEPLAGRGKGERAVVVGHLRTETWQKDGKPQSQLVLVCEALHFLGLETKQSVSESESDSTHPEALPGANQEVPF